MHRTPKWNALLGIDPLITFLTCASFRAETGPFLRIVRKSK
jgi:hypothetical protein